MEGEVNHGNKTFWIWIFIVVFVVIAPIVANDYRYNRCIRINKEEFNKCKNGELGNYDCSVFDNGEELCGMAIFRY